MTNFVNPHFPTEHPGVARAEQAISAVRSMRKGFDGTKGLAALLLAAVVSALVVAADQVVDTWVDGHLLAMWVILWAVGFAAAALFAGTARQLARRCVAGARAWSQEAAQADADAQFLSHARKDPRIMAELLAAVARDGASAPALK